MLSPAFLWAFAAVAPLVAIYLLKVRPRRHVVTASFLWRRVFTEKRSTALFKRLRDIFSLLLMLMALSAMVLAMTRPRWDSIRHADMLILIDNSASMSSIDGASSRIELARHTARRIVDAVGGDQRVAVAAVADRIEFRSHLTDDTRALRDAIGSIQPTCLPLHTRALRDIVPPVGTSGYFRVLLLSDGMATDFSPPEGVEWMKIGVRRDNAGIVAADLSVAGAEGGLSLFFQLASNFAEPRNADVLVSREGVTVKVVPVTIDPGRNKPQVMNIAGDAGKYELRLNLNDALALDNVAHLFIPPPTPIRVAVRAADRYFFDHSVMAFAKSASRLHLVDADADVTIDQSGAGEGPLSIIFAPRGESPWWRTAGGEIDRPVPRHKATTHDALRYLPVEDMAFVGARRVTVPPGSSVMVEDEQGVPLIWQSRQEDRVAVVVNLDPAAGDFVFSPYFPVLIHGVTTYLGGRGHPPASVSSTADRVPLPGASPGSRLTLTSPDGVVTRHEAGDLPQLTSPGFYLVESVQGQTYLASALLDAGETTGPASEAHATAQPVEHGWSIATWLILVGMVVLATEELAYHRRKVG